MATENILYTGASSKLGSRLLRALLDGPQAPAVWSGCFRRPSGLPDARVRDFPLDLRAPLDLTPAAGPIGLAVHLAGLTHSDSAAAYEQVNHQGTLRLAQAVYARGCRRFVYVSTRCVGPGCGAYGESKRRAEEALRGFAWESLLILRPAEVYGTGGAEGVDRLLSLAASLHVVPLLFGHPGVRFAPLHCGDFVRAAAAAIAKPRPGVTVLELCGPEPLSGAELALRIARRHRALPLPVWLPAVGALGRAAAAVGIRLFSPDQLDRLTGTKSAERPSDDPALAFELSRFPA